MLRRVALVRTDVSEELSASFIRVTKIGELGKTLGVTSQKAPFFRTTVTEAKLYCDEQRTAVGCMDSSKI
jgi:hypothetical protein